MTLYLVFEHIEQDLATYLAQCPKPGMSSEIIKVPIKTFYLTFYYIGRYLGIKYNIIVI